MDGVVILNCPTWPAKFLFLLIPSFFKIHLPALSPPFPSSLFPHSHKSDSVLPMTHPKTSTSEVYPCTVNVRETRDVLLRPEQGEGDRISLLWRFHDWEYGGHSNDRLRLAVMLKMQSEHISEEAFILASKQQGFLFKAARILTTWTVRGVCHRAGNGANHLEAKVSILGSELNSAPIPWTHLRTLLQRSTRPDGVLMTAVRSWMEDSAVCPCSEAVWH